MKPKLNINSITAICPQCIHNPSTFVFTGHCINVSKGNKYEVYLFMECDKCHCGAIAKLLSSRSCEHKSYDKDSIVADFYPFPITHKQLPTDLPDDIKVDFEEAESCLHSGYIKAAGMLFRAVLEKSFIAIGYKNNEDRISLEKLINKAYEDRIISSILKDSAHDCVRKLGNIITHTRNDSREEVKNKAYEAYDVLEEIINCFYKRKEKVLQLISSDQADWQTP